MKNLLGLVAIVVGVFLVGPPAKRAVLGMLDRGAVPQSLVEAPWEKQNVGNVTFDAPWSLPAKNLDFPAEVKNHIDSSETQMREKDGLTIMAMRVTYYPDVQVSLHGAIEGAEKSLRAQPETQSVKFSYDETTVGGYRGAVIDALVTQKKGPQLRCRALVVARKESLYQVLVSYRADQPNGEAAWRRVRGSVLVDGRT
jgi:hypothetical protein